MTTYKYPQSPYSVSSPKRESTTKFSDSWKLPSSASSGDKAYQSQHVFWDSRESKLETVNGKETWVWQKENVSLSSKDIPVKNTSDTLIIKRNDFYPVNKSRRLLEIWFTTEGRNAAGRAKTWPKAFKFSTPKKPTATFSYEDGILTVTVSAPYDAKKDKYDCVYKLYRQDVGTTSSRYGNGKKLLALNAKAKTISGTTKKDKFTLKTSVEQAYLKDGARITFTLELTARGFAGDTVVTREFVISTPDRAQITKVDISNKDKLNLVNNLVSAKFNTGAVRVFYNQTSGTPTAAYNTSNPTVYSLERLVSSWKVNNVVKANVQDGWEQVDSQAGSTSESAIKYRKTKRYSDITYQKSAGMPYYSAIDIEGKKIENIPGWKLVAYKQKKHVLPSGQSVPMYYNYKKTKTVKVWYYKAYDKKTKKTVKNIPPWRRQEYKSATYTVGKKKLARYSNIQKDGTKTRNVKYYKAYDEKKEKTVTGIPAWKISDYSKATITVAANPSDGVMGEALTDVLSAMGFTETATVYDKRVWYRIKCERFGMVEYSQAFEAKELRAPSPSISEDYTGFMRIAQNPKEPGTSIIGTIGWDNKDKTDEGIDNPNWKDATWTTIVQWSKHAQAHRSNENANELEIDWKNSSAVHSARQKEYAKAVKSGKFGTKRKGYAVNRPVPWKKSADFVIYGLEAGVPVYLWGLRHMVLDSFDKKGPRTSAPTKPTGYFPFTPIDNPTSVAAYTEQYYTYGTDLTVSWTHNATCSQKSWNVYVIPAEETYTAKNYKKGVTNISSIPKKLVASGIGKTDHATIKASVLKNLMGSKACVIGKKSFSVIKRLGIVVGVSTGGKEVFSCQTAKGKYTKANFMKIAHKPTIAMYALAKYTKPEYRNVFLFTNTKDAYGVVNVYAAGETSLHLPDGEIHQGEGECVWTKTVQKTAFKPPSKALTVNQRKVTTIKAYCNKYAYVAVVSIPKTLKTLYDGSSYRIDAHMVSTIDSELLSNTVTRTVKCSYSHQPAKPGSASRIVTDIGGRFVTFSQPSKAYTAAKSVKDNALTSPPTASIYCAKPKTGFASGDRCRVYRITPDGGELITSDIYFNRVVIDRYAPFSKVAMTRYAIMTVTPAGDVNWREVYYNLKRHGMRFDWGPLDRERSIELPFNIELNESYSKNVRIDSYMDGTIAAHFNKGVTKTETANTKLVRLQNPVQFELVKELAQYEGTAFFRAHDGSAFECTVEVSGLANNFDSQVSPVSFNMTRVTLSDRFKPQKADIKTRS